MRSRRLGLAILALLCGAAMGQPHEELDEYEELEALSQAQMEAYMDQARALAQGLAPDRDMQPLAAETARMARGQLGEATVDLAGLVEASRHEVGERDGSLVITIFVSRSLGPQTLLEIFDDLRHHANARAVFRGVADGQRLGDAIREIHAIASPDADGRVPHVEIDPVAFSRHGIAAVPVMIAERDGQVLVRVDGGTSVEFLLRTLEELEEYPGNRRRIRVGSLEDVAEEDLIEAAKARIASLDMDALRSDALDRAFSRLAATGTTFPVARVHRSRIIDPSIEVAAPREPQDDHLSAYVAAGTRINPLDVQPFTQVLAIVDPTYEGQVVTAEVALGQHLASHPGRRVTWIATRLDTEAGWEGLAALEDRLRAPVYLIDQRITARFAIERVPSLVYAEDRRFVVEEIPVEGIRDESGRE